MDVTIKPIPLPHPYRSALAFVSDIDGSTFPSFARVLGCFYGTEPDYEGIELELASSMWLMARPQRGVMRNSIYALELDGVERDFVRGRIAPFLGSALFDSIHTYGTFKGQFERAHAERCVEYAQQHRIQPQFWTFHGSREETHNAVVGGPEWAGDDPDAEVYHLDLLDDLGVRYHRTPPGLDLVTGRSQHRVVDALDGRPVLVKTCHAFLSEPTDADELTVWVEELERRQLLQVARKRIFKASDRWPDRLLTWHPELLWAQLADEVLEAAVSTGRMLYVNQHLTRSKSTFAYAEDRTRDAIRRLDELHRAQDMLVTSPARLITFELIRDHGDHRTEVTSAGVTRLHLAERIQVDGWSTELHEPDLDGVGFDHDGELELWFRGRPLPTTTAQLDGTRRRTFVPWSSRVAEQRAALVEFRATFGDDDG